LEYVGAADSSWLSIAFTAAVIVIVVAIAHKEPAVWVGLLALLPLALLLCTGLYLIIFVCTAVCREVA
jgi:hypothetical protein